MYLARTTEFIEAPIMYGGGGKDPPGNRWMVSEEIGLV